MSEENINTGTAEFNITGIANVNETLTLVKKSDDPDGNGEFNYKWESSSDGINWENIGEGISYELTPSEENKQLRANVSYTDNKGNSDKIFAKTNNVQGEILWFKTATFGTAKSPSSPNTGHHLEPRLLNLFNNGKSIADFIF